MRTDHTMLTLERTLAHPIDRVWRAVSEPGELAAWFVAAVSWTPAVGEPIEAYGRHAGLGSWFPADEPLDVVLSEAPNLLAGRWYGDMLRFELHPDGDGCVLVMMHAFADRDTAARTAAGWDRCLARLRAALDGAPMSEAESLEAWPEAHERYAARFGVDPELGRRAFAEHPTRR